MADINSLVDNLADYKTRLYNRLVAQGDNTVNVNDSLDTYISHYEKFRRVNNQNVTITENGSYTIPAGHTGYGELTVNVPSGGGMSHKKYTVGDRVYPDNSEDSIGTVVGFYVDDENIEYAVVALDAVYRSNEALTFETPESYYAITDLPESDTLHNQVLTLGSGGKSATYNCDKIKMHYDALSESLDTDYTYPALSFCRNISFNIGGNTYYGQIPNYTELFYICANYSMLKLSDPTENSVEDNQKLDSILWKESVWSSTQYNSRSIWGLTSNGYPSGHYRQFPNTVLPILEIPNVNNTNTNNNS